MSIFTVDLDFMSLEVQAKKPFSRVWNTRMRFRARQCVEVEKARKLNQPMIGAFEESEDVAIMRKAYTEEFEQLFIMGYQNYIWGEWKVAKNYFTKTSTLLDFKDGPSEALLKFMARHGSEA